MLFISIIFVSLIAVSAVSAADNVNDTVAVSDEANIVAVENDKIVSADVEESDVLAADNADEIVSADDSDKETVLSDGSSSFGSGSGIDIEKLFNGTSITFGNGTSFNMGDLFNGTTISFGNGTSFNTSSLFGANFTFGNSSFNISSLIGGNGTSFDISKILDMMGGTTKESINATDASGVYLKDIIFKVTVMKGNETLTTGTVVFTIDNKEYTGHIGSDGVASVTFNNLKPGDHFITSEYGDVLVKNIISVEKAVPVLTAKNKAFKAKTKTKKYTVTLKNSKKKAIKNVKVTLKVNGKTYSAKTNSKGQAIFKLTKLTKVGKLPATVKFAGNAYYKASQKSVKITVKK
ncbi:Ig-like domain-containing protein [Methanobrevibacter sp.]|uniref:Ig-like domain-containing protein n=1 Tax=Methanobrevibacter sp. TaxID=66852 RepID=UPI00386B90DA